MPKLRASKDEITGALPMNEGLMLVRLDGFKPGYSKDRGSISLNPQMRVINHAEYNDRPIFENLNLKAKWIWKDFCHAFGVALESDKDGDVLFPGNFTGPDDQPEKWQYEGPLLGQTGQIYLIQSEYNGVKNNKIRQYICRVQGCSERHSNNLNK